VTEVAAATDESAVELEQIKRLISLFTEGVSGRALNINAFEPNQPVGDAHRAPVISSDGQSIFLPSFFDTHASAQENFGAYRISVLHQVGYDEFGTFRFNLKRASLHIPEIGQKLKEQQARIDSGDQPSPPPIKTPAAKQLDIEQFFTLWPNANLTRAFFQTVEAWRIDRAVAENYPGARADLQREMRFALAQRKAPSGHHVSQIHERLTRYTLGDTETLTESKAPVLQEIAGLMESLPQTNHSVYDSARITAQIVERVSSEYLTVSEALPLDADSLGEVMSTDEATADEEPSEGNPVQYRGEPFEMPAMIKRREHAQENADQEMTNLLDADAPDDEDDDDESQVSPLIDSLTPRPPAPKEDELHIKIEEWNYLKQRYIKDWCTIVQYPLAGEAGSFHRDLMTRHRDSFVRTRRQFNSIRPEAIRRERHQPDGEEFELDRLIERFADRRAGLSGDDRLYYQRQRAERDVSAAFLLDMSASTDFPVVDPTELEAVAAPSTTNTDPADDIGWAPNQTMGQIKPAPSPKPKRRVIDVARESLALMSSALETLGDRYAIFGFSGQGRHWVSFGVAKQFNERCTSKTWGAIAAIGPQGSTRMGAAVRHTTNQLKEERAKLKVLIIVSDGYPQDMDYGPDRGNDEYGLQDTAMALTEATRLGIETFCLTVDPAGNDYLRRMCPDQRYLVIDEVNALPMELSKVYRTLTTRSA
jgi:nitric oxide reductase activation protein